MEFTQKYLTADPVGDLSCQEAWTFFEEIAQAGELPPMGKATFLCELPVVIESVYNIRKCHHILRSGRRVRGFRGVDIRMDA